MTYDENPRAPHEEKKKDFDALHDALLEEGYRLASPLLEAVESKGVRVSSFLEAERLLGMKADALPPFACASLLRATEGEAAERAFEILVRKSGEVPSAHRASMFAHALGNSLLSDSSSERLAAMFSESENAPDSVQYVFASRGKNVPSEKRRFPPECERTLVGTALSSGEGAALARRVKTLFYTAAGSGEKECLLSPESVRALLSGVLGTRFETDAEKTEILGSVMRRTPGVGFIDPLVEEFSSLAARNGISVAYEAASSLSFRISSLRNNELGGEFGDEIARGLDAVVRMETNAPKEERKGTVRLLTAILSAGEYGYSDSLFPALLRAFGAAGAENILERIGRTSGTFEARESLHAFLSSVQKRLSTISEGEDGVSGEQFVEAVFSMLGSNLAECCATRYGDAFDMLFEEISGAAAALMALRTERGRGGAPWGEPSL